MTTPLSARLDRAIAGLAHAYPGPGGAIAVLKDGEVLARHAWGYANAERRIDFTPKTLFRMCSVTKQFTCALVLDAFADVSVLDGDVAARLPNLQGPAPTALHLCHNQSGLRDYWAVAMLHGSPAEAFFGDAEAARVIAGTRTLQFAPGTRFSYVNQNFRILSDILQDRAGRSFAELLRTRLFDRVGMETAFLAADTRAMPDGTEGYEPVALGGARPGVNNILWTGDAGLGASLDDMIAWERWIDASRGDPDSLYGRMSAPVTFSDGATAGYGFGLGRGKLLGRDSVGHGGALRGWRCHRVYLPAERVSVVVLLNHLSHAHEAATDLLSAVLDEPRPSAPAAQAAPTWLGAYVEPETGLSVRIEAASPGRVLVRYGHGPATLDLNPDGTAGEGPVLKPGDDGLWMTLTGDNQSSLLSPRPGEASLAIAGRYHCEDLDADLTITGAGKALYGGFSGFLGLGRMELLEPIGPDLWALPCPRALDHTPPGDWTLAFQRDGAGMIDRVTVGCWLARGLEYGRVG